MSALRDTEGKLNWVLLFEHFPLALKELCRAREFGARHYTKDGKDGATNWRESINGPEHDKFYKGCIRGNISHNFKPLWGEDRDAVQDNVHHLAFGALNDLMALEYALAKELKDQQHEIDLASLQVVEYGDETRNCLTGEPIKQTIYDWSKIPEKFNWCATDYTGEEYAYTQEPEQSQNTKSWAASTSVEISLIQESWGTCEDWEDSLEARPMTLYRIVELNDSI